MVLYNTVHCCVTVLYNMLYIIVSNFCHDLREWMAEIIMAEIIEAHGFLGQIPVTQF